MRSLGPSILDKSSKSNQKNVPRFFNLLNADDQERYILIQEELANQETKNRRNKSLEAFLEAMAKVRDFVKRGDDDDIIRSLVCGIVWMENGIAINIHQLRIITNKCKSTINHSFQSLEYGTVPSGSEMQEQLHEMFPYMKGNFSEQRQWTIRQKLSDETMHEKLIDIVRKKNEEYETPPPVEPESTDDGIIIEASKHQLKSTKGTLHDNKSSEIDLSHNDNIFHDESFFDLNSFSLFAQIEDINDFVDDEAFFMY